jgi:hypothetical protein
MQIYSSVTRETLCRRDCLALFRSSPMKGSPTVRIIVYRTLISSIVSVESLPQYPSLEIFLQSSSQQDVGIIHWSLNRITNEQYQIRHYGCTWRRRLRDDRGRAEEASCKCCIFNDDSERCGISMRITTPSPATREIVLASSKRMTCDLPSIVLLL